MNDLKPCPFCGGKAIRCDNEFMKFVDRNSKYGIDVCVEPADVFGVKCTQCSHKLIGYKTQEEADVMWNFSKNLI